MKNKQTEINNSIQSVSIRKETKEFCFQSVYNDKEKQLEYKKNCEERINEFKKNNFVISVDYVGGYNNKTVVTYYVGKVNFSPIKQDDSSIQLNIEIKQDSIKSIIAMCLDIVCNLCETQTKAFQNRFVEFVGENQESLVKQSETIKRGLIARGFDKVLKLKD